MGPGIVTGRGAAKDYIFSCTDLASDMSLTHVVGPSTED